MPGVLYKWRCSNITIWMHHLIQCIGLSMVFKTLVTEKNVEKQFGSILIAKYSVQTWILKHKDLKTSANSVFAFTS